MTPRRRSPSSTPPGCGIVPPFLLERIVRAHPDGHAVRCGRATLTVDADLRAGRLAAPPAMAPEVSGEAAASATAGDDAWTVHTAAHGSGLPGDPVRSTGDPASGDPAVDEAYDGTEATLALYRQVFSRQSYDARGAPVVVTVHYQQDYDNAFWNGRQLVFGDGDGKVFGRFTKPVDVLGHEFTHAVTQYTAGLEYSGQSGALNESMSDVFGILVKQRSLGHTAADADWLVGEGIFLPSVQGRALRSMRAPGTAYDDPSLGKDPQVGDMSDYVDTTDDDGGVHINSGIPNRAFYLAATGLGGHAWEQAGPIWYAALASEAVSSSTDFAGFAQATLDAAAALDVGGASARSVVASAWSRVGVSPGAPGQQPGPSAPPAGSERAVSVRRTGGFAGQVREGAVDLDSDPRAAEVTRLVERVDLGSLRWSGPQPDRYVYTFRVRGREIVLGEQDLTPDLLRLASLLLAD